MATAIKNGLEVEYKEVSYTVVSVSKTVVLLVKTEEVDTEGAKEYRVKPGSDRYNEIFASVLNDTTEDDFEDEIEEQEEEQEVEIEEEKPRPAPKKKTPTKKVVEPKIEDEEEPAPAKNVPAKKKAPAKEVAEDKPAKKTTKKVAKEPEPEEEELNDFAWEPFSQLETRIDRIADGETPTDRLITAAMYSVSDPFTAFLVWTYINTDKLNLDFNTICELQLDGETPAVPDEERIYKDFCDQAITDMWNWLSEYGLSSKVPTDEAHKAFIKYVPIEGQEYLFYLSTNLGWNSFRNLKLNKKNAESIPTLATKINLDGGLA